MEGYYVHESSYIDAPCTIGRGTRIWHFCHIQKGATIGEGCTLGQNVNIGPGVIMGRGVKIQNNVSVYQGVELEDYVFCGPSVVFTNVINPRSEFSIDPNSYKKTVVKRGATLGANSTIICGHTIGSYSLIAAGSVVTKDVPDYALIIGCPGKQKGWVCECGERLSHKLTCPNCGKSYLLEKGILYPYLEKKGDNHGI
ncbi:acyltransferase [Alloiococcus sp. CFN-8]|uniref:acyltransferase n=1 Tax=Alloiococcus sp. CFN-8 TaxID=3416081 RepID=UPI003CF3FB82